MTDIKRYYYLKLKDNFFDSEEIKILESLPNGIYYSNLLIKLYLRSLKYNGALRFNDYIPYDENMIATITNLNIDIVKSGLMVLSNVKLIERLDDGTIYMMNIQSFIGKSNSEADRKRLYREKIEGEKQLIEQSKESSNGQMSLKCPIEKGTSSNINLDKHPPEREKKLDIELELDNRDNEEIIKNESICILNNFEKTTGLIGALNLGAIKVAVEQHGAKYVKAAIDISIEKNKASMIYINGILKNWAKEGYPKGDEYYGSTGKNNGAGTNEFKDFKPHEPRALSDDERTAIKDELL